MNILNKVTCMGAIDEIQHKLINFFSYKTKSGEVKEINTSYGQKWENMKTDNQTINSIFAQVDNGDGIVQAEELNILNKIFNYIDKIFNKDEILDENEIKEFQKQLYNGTITLDQIKNSSSKQQTPAWSEGLDRNISTIQISNTTSTENLELTKELKAIGEEQGFNVESIDSGIDPWIEDSYIRRSDGKLYVPYHNLKDNYDTQSETTFLSERGNENNTGQGRVATEGTAFEIKFNKEDIHYGTSYLEGGNVLNTKLQDGTPAAIVGEGSISKSLELMGLENTPENIDNVKKQIAADLGLTPEQVTFIPQHEFHIDMTYRPLGNGEFAVPDYETGLKILKELKDELGKQEAENTNTKPNSMTPLQIKLRKLDNKIKKLEQLAADTKNIREEANDYLEQAGYTVVKIPNFTVNDVDTTNFMNGIGGTSAKTGQTFYITNKAEYPELEPIITKYFNDAGIDKVYFVSTRKALSAQGGIDCLTQEK